MIVVKDGTLEYKLKRTKNNIRNIMRGIVLAKNKTGHKITFMTT